MQSLKNHNLKATSNPNDSAFMVLIVQGVAMKAPTSVIPALWAGGKVKIPLGCWLKILGEAQSQIPIQKAYLATVLITALVWLSVSLFFPLVFKIFESILCILNVGYVETYRTINGMVMIVFFFVCVKSVFPFSQCSGSEISVSVLLEPTLWLFLFANWSFYLFLHSKCMSTVQEQSLSLLLCNQKSHGF